MSTQLERYHNIMEQLDALSAARTELWMKIVESMERDGATEWVDGPHTAKLKYSPAYSQDRLRATMPELVPEDALVKAGAYIPEHQKPVPGRYDLTKLKPFGKQGAAIRKAIEDAKDLGPPRLTVTMEGEK